MLSLPEVFERVPGLELAPWYEKRFDQRPDFSFLPFQFREKQPCVFDVDVVAPGADLHRQKLLRRDGPDDERRALEKPLSGCQSVKIAFRSVVQPVFRKVQAAGDPPRCGMNDG